MENTCALVAGHGPPVAAPKDLIRSLIGRPLLHTQLSLQETHSEYGKEGLLSGLMWVVVKIMVPSWVPIIIRHLLFRVPKRDHNFDNYPCGLQEGLHLGICRV